MARVVELMKCHHVMLHETHDWMIQINIQHNLVPMALSPLGSGDTDRSMCVGFLTVSLKLLLDHLRRNHGSDPNFHLLCGLDGCPRTYRRFVSFRNHLIRKHNFKLRDEDRGRQINANNENGGEEIDRDVEPEELVINPDDPIERDAEQVRADNALCLLGFKDKGCVPQTVVNLFVESSTQLIRNSMQLAESEVRQRLAAVGTNIEAIPGLKEIFQEDSLAMNPFGGIEGEQQQHQFYQDNFDLVEPRKIILGRYHVKVRRGNKLKEVEKTDDAFYIPLLESLQQLLNNESILEEVENPHSRDDDLLSDFCDTDNFKSHLLFGADPYALQLLLYFDEVEVCNPLGTRANKHKLAALYYTLGNIKPHNRSHMNAIQLLGLITSRHLKIYGIEPLLNAFMDDLFQLEQDAGYLFLVNNEARYFRGTIAYFSADNLGAQYIGGYKQGSQAHRKCRECMANNAEIQSQSNRMFVSPEGCNIDSNIAILVNSASSQVAQGSYFKRRTSHVMIF